ncbi:carboxypeptidase regulatory-like domain-containing protein [bacterium]|nr:MAG: carboxypeptidase regulatory-like domain-containing protein [bacterium]
MGDGLAHTACAWLRSVCLAIAPLTVAACGGGGGGTGAPVMPGGSAPSSSGALSGVVTDDASPVPSPLAGATVSLFTANTPLAGLAPLASATTAPNGAWSIASGPAPGTYLLQIAPADASHAAQHRSVTLAAGANALGGTQLTMLSATEQQCIALFNQKRVSLGVPVLPVDNAAMIAARAEAQAVSAWGGIGQFVDPTPVVYANANGVGSIASPDADSGGADCAMAAGNFLNPTWNNVLNSLYVVNANARAVWMGFALAIQPLPGFPSNMDYAAAVVIYP